MNRDEMKGKVDKAKGYIKEETGEITGNEDLEAEGRAERAGGTARETLGKAERNAKKAVDKADELIEGQ
jgi:uncharacterized protein YjbJ (UPF0337 family)